MLLEERMLKDNQLLSGTDTTESTKDGESPILINLKRFKERDTAPDSVSIS
jgi:hypothetical protein